MAVVGKERKHKTIYYAVNRWRGRYVWERSGEDQREAGRLDARVKKQIAAGTYEPKRTGATKVRGFAAEWFSKRKTRTVENESDLWDNHVVRRCSWFVEMRVEDVRAKDLLRLVEQLAMPYDDGHGNERRLASKSIALIYGFIKTMFGSAVFEEIINRNPCDLPRGTLSRKPAKKRVPYTTADVRALLTEPTVDPDRRLWIALAFYTGMREGEVCGRRWRDIDREAAPLWALDVHSQYQDQPLKTDDEKQSRPRKVPVHPELARALDWWWNEGWEFVYCRRPRLDDFIVPRRDGLELCLSKSMAYKAWREACLRAKVESHTLHSTRHTFVSTCRRRGARAEVVEVITHNPEGKMIDQYTTWDWHPLCDAVMFCDYTGSDWTAPIPAAKPSSPAGSGGSPISQGALGLASSCNSAFLTTGSSPGAGAQKIDTEKASLSGPLVPGLPGLRPAPPVGDFVAGQLSEAFPHLYRGESGLEQVLAPLRKAALAIDAGEPTEGAVEGAAQ